jgi:phosphoglucosamine mutase
LSRRYFGTDGIRGRVGEHPMTAEFAMRLASSAAEALVPEGGKVLIGKDTRVSGYMFESALEAGFVAAGADVLLLGPLPTPGIAHLTQKFEADLGVVISASHNAYYDNGIKFFDRQGGKLSDQIELAIEAGLEEPARTKDSAHLGQAQRIDSARRQYMEFCQSTLPADLSLEGLKVVIDGANGAGYKVAPRVLGALGAEVIPIGCSPNGRNINDGCGSLHPGLLQLTVPGVRADVGIALDGDGDRVVMVDHQGNIIDGDQLLYVVALARQRAGELTGPVVGTVMSNLGLELALGEAGIEFRRAKVGDRYVMELLRETGGVLGGETSGHIICLDRTTTGDGLVSALQTLAIMKESGESLQALAAGMPRMPQHMVNVRVASRIDLDGSATVQKAVAEVQEHLGGRGRVVLRPSGTEPVIRVMVEGEDAGEVEELARRIATVVERSAA